MKVAALLAFVALAVVGSGTTGSLAPLLVVSSDYTQWSSDHVFAYAPGRRLRALALGSGATASPYGRRVAFVRDGALFTVRADGGAERRVAALAGPLSFDGSVVWSDDGRHVAVPLPDRIALVDLASGTVGNVVTTAAAFSPDGEHVAYLDANGLEVANADGADPRVVAPGWGEAGGIAWSHDGEWIAFVGYGEGGAPRLALVRPDGTGLRTLASGGVALPGPPAWSRDGRLAWVSSSRVQVATPGGRVGTAALVKGIVGYPQHAPAWSGDGRLLAVRVRGGMIALVPAGGGRARLVHPPAPAAALPGGISWLGTRLVFSAHKTRTDSELALVRADGSGFRELTSNGVADRDPGWSPDGRTIVFVRFGARRHGLYEMSSAGGSVQRLTVGEDRAPAFSPDGRSIAFGRGSSIRLLDLRTRTSRQLAKTRIKPRQLSWTKDGTSIVFGDDYALRVLDVETGTVRPLDVHTDAAFRPVVAPDGTRLAFLALRDQRYFRDPAAWGIFVGSLDGTNVRRITSNDKSGPLSWSPDGTELVAGDGTRLELVDVASGRSSALLPAGYSTSAAFRP